MQLFSLYKIGSLISEAVQQTLGSLHKKKEEANFTSSSLIIISCEKNAPFHQLSNKISGYNFLIIKPTKVKVKQ